MNLGREFSEYNLDEHLKKALAEQGFERSTPIQDKAIPLVVSGQDVAGLAQTGTGKTAAFLLPLIERVLRSGKKSGDDELDSRGFPDWKHNNFNLILVPTRELAEQVKDCALDFLKGTDLRAIVVYGGVSIDKQIEQLGKGFTFLIATPGRLIDHYKEHRVDLKQVRSVTFDEADRMFDMGFKDDMKYILRRIPENRQLLLFSATLNLEVFNVAYQFGANPVEIKVSQDQKTADNVDDFIFHLGRDEKPTHLLGLIEKMKPKQVIIFTNFKSQVERIAEFLNKNKHKAVGISSLLSQAQRKRVMTRFREEGGENILVATDVAARGLDIEGVDLVINYELPDDAENYVHRIGRTGRAGEKGKAYSFVSDKDVEALDRIKVYLDRSINAEWLEDNELPTEFSSFPRGELIMNRSRTKNDRPKRGEKRRRHPDDKKNGDDKKRSDYKKRGDGKKRGDYNKTDNRKRPDNRNKEGEEEKDERNIHRDRRSGRHHKKDDKDKNRQHGKRSENSKKSNHKKYDDKKKQARKKPHKHPKPKKPEKSIVSRLGKAIKGLFK